MGASRNSTEICQEVAALVDAWCERRELSALREILKGWPIISGLTDDWGELAAALRSIAGMRELPDDDRRNVKRLSVEIDVMLRNR